MDKYLLAIIGIIVFSILVILFVKISSKFAEVIALEIDVNSEDGEDKSTMIKDNNNVGDNTDPLSHLKSDDFTLLE